MISDTRSFFMDCLQCVKSGEIPDRDSTSVARFLHAIGYLPRTLDIPSEVLANRLALLGVASRLDEFFQFPCPYARDVWLFGGVVSARAFGVSGHEPDPAGAGGRGMTARAAFESCVGEAAEYLTFLEREDDPRVSVPLEPPGIQDGNLKWALSKIGYHGSDLKPVEGWIDASSLWDGRRQWFPSELFLRRQTARRRGRMPAESNGVSGGVSRENAIGSALLELVERDAIALWWYGGRRARKLSAECREAVLNSEEVRGSGRDDRRALDFLDLTTDLDVPAVAALSCDHEGRSVVVGFSAATSLETAARRAYLELCQMEMAQELSLRKREELGESGLQEGDRVWMERAQRLAISGFSQFLPRERRATDVSPSGSFALSELPERLTRKGFEPFYRDLTVDEIGVPVVRVIVPGLASAKSDWTNPRLLAEAGRNGIDPASWSESLCPI